ncbi:MAG: acylphosphatase [Treponemataceae bacterium]|jgi:acylphosphatase|nr:acylphosphatase [Treponemataceae bacterium]HOJ99917.1 acylphosphatase [Termitinemataceae bacterium]HOM23973.1 acylphosphatase [Termitinemataceae bacterium]HPQ01046.1 acylphosphatase [Termitinemataceae bacterium]
MTEGSPETQGAVHCIVHGRVQGVGFRYATMQEASRRGIVGWVKNRWDGTVEVYAEGSMAALTSFLRWLEKGPPGARVERIEAGWQKPSGAYRRFSIEY